MTRIAFAFLLAACAPFALAHTPSESTHPVDGATLEAVPEMLHVKFAEPTRVVKVVLTHTGPEGTHETRLAPPSKEPTEMLHLTPELPGTGEYALTWRALGADGHVVTGSFTFRVR